MVDVAINEAMEIRKLGDLDEAIRFLDTGSDVIERFTPNLLSLLKVMIKFSRMMSAVTPVDPVLPQNFHLAELANLAQLNRILHQILMSTKQRFRLKLYILGKGVSIASRYLVQSIKNVVTRRSAVDREWEEVAKIGQDFQKLSNESVQSFRSLLEALSTDAAKELARALYLPEVSHTPLRHITPGSLLPSPHEPAAAALPVQKVGALPITPSFRDCLGPAVPLPTFTPVRFSSKTLQQANAIGFPACGEERHLDGPDKPAQRGHRPRRRPDIIIPLATPQRLHISFGRFFRVTNGIMMTVDAAQPESRRDSVLSRLQGGMRLRRS
jgi:hypothetical protein